MITAPEAIAPSAAEGARSAPADESFAPPYRLPYHLGLFLAVNAIPDVYAVIDGPDCIFRKAEWIHGKHDISSTLLDVFGNHRVAHTNNNADAVIKSRGEVVEERIRQIDRLPGAKAVLVCSMPHVTIIGTQYDRILRLLEPEVGCLLMEVPSRSLHADWLHGYADTLEVLAANVDLEGARPDPDKVAIVGHLMDRGEQDQMGNVRELERLFAGIGLEVASIWLSGQPLRRLEDVKHAGTIVSLPSGRAAARLLAERTGARLVEVELPFGASRTRRMLDAVGRATGREARVRAFVDRELATIVPRLEWIVPHTFMGRRLIFAGNPHLFGAMLQLTSEVGMKVTLLCSSAQEKHFREDLEPVFGPLPPMLFSSKDQPLDVTLRRAIEEAPVDLLVCDAQFMHLASASGVPVLEFGFPSFTNHALYDRPFLGFSGWVCFLDQMAQVIGRSPARASQGP